MLKEIVFTSSYSSQLGALISLAHYFNNLELKNHSKNIVVFHVSSKGDNSCNYSCFYDNAEVILGKNFNVKIIKINSIYKRLILLLCLYSFKIFGLDKNLSIWEPNPFWLKRLFYLKKFNFNLFRKDFKNIKFYGDGFLCLSEKSIPFWLDNGVFKSQNYSSSSIFYYFYKLHENKDTKNKYIEIKSSYIKNIFEKITSNQNKTTEENFGKLLIFPLTTFSETKRSSLESEIILYMEYLNKIVHNKKQHILVKPHPGNLEIKNKLLISRLKEQKFNVINKILEENIPLNLPLNIIPLELLILELVKILNINKKNISIALNSNATLSTCYLYPDVKHLDPFGEELIYKYIRKEFIKSRLIQEKILLKKIIQNKRWNQF